MKSVQSRPRLNILSLCLLAFAPFMAAGAACSQADVAAGSGGRGGGAGSASAGANSAAGGALLVIPDAGPVDACIPAVAPAACVTPAGAYCGLIGDGCNGQIDCGNNCPAGWTCDTTNHMCIGGADCKPSYQCTYTAGAATRLLLRQHLRRLWSCTRLWRHLRQPQAGLAVREQRMRGQRERLHARHLRSCGRGALLRKGG